MIERALVYVALTLMIACPMVLLADAAVRGSIHQPNFASAVAMFVSWVAGVSFGYAIPGRRGPRNDRRGNRRPS